MSDLPNVVLVHGMTALGADAPNVIGLVYVAAFGIDEGESLGALLGGGPPTPALANLVVDEQGFGWLPEADFVGHFAADLSWSPQTTRRSPLTPSGNLRCAWEPRPSRSPPGIWRWSRILTLSSSSSRPLRARCPAQSPRRADGRPRA
jgi:hypothetical protein